MVRLSRKRQDVAARVLFLCDKHRTRFGLPREYRGQAVEFSRRFNSVVDGDRDTSKCSKFSLQRASESRFLLDMPPYIKPEL